jgi:uncharacterized protein (TIGR03083 family)
MGGWNAMSYDGRDTILRVVRHEAEQFFDMAGEPGAWERATACPEWQVRDVVGHLVDTTESYFVAFDAARGQGEVAQAYGLPGMAQRVDTQARSLRALPQDELLDRAQADYAKFSDILEGLGEQDWTGLTVPHFYMGPLPAFFYPAFQLMDYGVHSWDIRQGTGRAHGLSGEVADLLVPFMFVLWQSTAAVPPAAAPSELGVRITTGPNAGETVMRVAPDGLSYEPGDLSGVPTVIEFDPASFVLTAFGRFNAGTVRGDTVAAADFLNLFFRI